MKLLMSVIRLFFVDKPVASIALGKNLNSSAIIEGVDVYFECKIKSNLPVYKVMWKQDVSVASVFFFQPLQVRFSRSNPFLCAIAHVPLCNERLGFR